MGCFSACFGSSRDRRRRCRRQQHKKHNQVQPRDQRNTDQDLVPSSLPVEQSQTSEEPVIISTVVEEIEEEKPEGESSPVYLRKRVTFDSNVKAYEPVSVEESAEFQNAATPKQHIDNGNDDDQNKHPKQDQSDDTSSEASSLTTSSSSYPSNNHRYQNCRDSDEDDEFDLDGQTDSDSDSDNEDEGDGELDYSDDDLHNESTTRFPSAATNDNGCFLKAGIEKPGQNVRDRSGYVHPVLNPVENLTQWKAAKSKKSSPPPQLNHHQPSDKENDQEPSFKVKSKKTVVNHEQVMAVDASLSNWLSSSSSSSSSDCCTTTPKPNKQPTTTSSTTPPPETRSPGNWAGSASPKSFEDRPILGALTVEEIRQMSASNSPIRKSPGHSPDDKFIIGSVGSYWRSESSDCSKSGKEKDFSSSASSSFKGIPNATSKYGEDKRVNWQSTPFEIRLENALNGAQG
ncbi:unnamed protein product [Linum tenue]|uniref:Uncharacterized protein n=1 Tax=Linum tenue TaxID=586396 RepID=A0AAV0LNB6_9ROSI|nr:unnamed protein product [Linum tenue]